jgi:hypothetical protein
MNRTTNRKRLRKCSCGRSIRCLGFRWFHPDDGSPACATINSNNKKWIALASFPQRRKNKRH